ncbi:MAG: caspase family protein, partial [Thermoguttaceae bacterium]|nr:caspase family protein [Thermoguttaceae bacterium]
VSKMNKRAKTSGWGKTGKRNRILAAALGFVATAGAFAAFAQSEAPREWKNYRGKTVVTGVIDLSKTVEGFPSDAEKPSSVWFRASDGTAFSYKYALLSADDKKAVDVALDLDAGPGPDPGERALAVVPKNCVRRAVLVGVNDYAEFSDLRFAGADVELVRERLVELGFASENIVALTTENGRSNSAFAPTQRNIERELRRILDASGPEDMVFIMFTGHGLQTDDFGGYAPYVGFAPSDAVATNDETVVDFGTTISLSKLFDDLNDCKAKFKWALIDACRENLSEGKKSLDDSKRLRPLDAPAGVIVLQSCAAKEFSYEDEEFGHGLFTHYFTESLGSVGDANEDGVVTMTEAFSRAQALVRKRTNGAGYDRVQTPYCRGDFADFPLADVKTAEAKKRWSAAVEARESGDYATALTEIDAALALMPEKPEYATEKKTIEDLKRQADEASTRREAEELAANAWTAYNKDKTSETNVGEAIRLMKEALEKCENASNRNALGIFEETLAAILDNKAEAEKLLAEAQAAFERKDYATAKSKCEASSRLVSSPDARALSAKIEDALAADDWNAPREAGTLKSLTVDGITYNFRY